MSDYVVNEKETFEYTYSAKQKDEVERIRAKYVPKKESKMEQLRKLDKKAEKPGQIVAMSIGIIGALLLGIGMCCCMLWGAELAVFVGGIILGIVGMIVAGSAYPLYLRITEKQRAKIAEQVIALSNELSLEN